MLDRLIAYLDARIGLRPALDRGPEGLYPKVKWVSNVWFEFLKRVGVLAVIAAAAKKLPVLEWLFLASLIILMMPVLSFLGRFELDIKTRFPQRYRPEFDGEISFPLPDGKRTWSYNWGVAVIWGLATTLIGIAIQALAMMLADALM